MDWPKALMEIMDKSEITEAFNLNLNSFVVIILGSLIIGLTCLTIYYTVYYENKRWSSLKYFEKSMIGFIIGLLSILCSSFFVASLQLIYKKYEQMDQMLQQLIYLGPFLYFVAFCLVNSKKIYKKLDFIKDYIQFSCIFIFGMSFVLLILIFIIYQLWLGLFYTIILLLFFVYFNYLSKKRLNKK